MKSYKNYYYHFFAAGLEGGEQNWAYMICLTVSPKKELGGEGLWRNSKVGGGGNRRS